jgi:hypothetical protein
MEGHLLQLIHLAAVRIDSLFQQSLRRAIPEVERLSSDPMGTLARGDITIRPVRRYAAATLSAALAAVLFWWLIAVPNRLLAGAPQEQSVGLTIVAVVIAIPLVARLFPGGWCILTTTGVELRFKRQVVFCPWSLFNSSGTLRASAKDGEQAAVVLPVAPAAVPFVELREDGLVRVQGRNVNTAQFRFLSDHEAEFAGLYAVDAAELGGLLLEIGCALGTSLPGRAVPTVESDPADFLKHGAIRFGPQTRWGLGLAVGIGVGVIFWLLGIVLVRYAMQIAVQQFPNLPMPAAPVDALVFLAVSPLVSLWVGIAIGRGGTCILGGDGVRMIRGTNEVFCPWDLFSAPGRPIIHFRQNATETNPTGEFELPVASTAVHRVEARKHGVLIARGMNVKTAQFRFRSPEVAALTNFSRVSTAEFAGTLLTWGRLLGHAPPAGAAAAMEPGPAALESAGRCDNDGWITVHLTRLAFPPACCDCGAPTATTQPFTVHHNLGHAPIAIPVCEPCQRAFQRTYRRAFWKPFLATVAIGAGTGFLAGLVVTGAQRKFGFPEVAIIFSILLGVVSLFVGWFVSKRQATRIVPPPVQVRRYLKNGNVTLRFRRPEYAAQMLALTQLPTDV